MRHRSEYIECGVCGLTTGPVDNDVGDDEDPGAPPGWVTCTVARVVQVPTSEEGSLSRLISMVPPEMQPLYSAIAEAQKGAAYAVEEIEIHLCPDHLRPLVALDPDAFREAGWNVDADAEDVDGIGPED